MRPLAAQKKSVVCIHGAFSSEVRSTAGFGATKTAIRNKMFVFAEQRSDSTVSVTFINQNNVPSGQTREIPLDEFLASYVPEPQFYQETVFPAMRELGKTIAKAERYRENGKLFSSEMEFKNALRVDEKNIRATFGLGLVYLDRAETEMADMVFRRLVTLDAAFEQAHKHLFNEFGIRLRKAGMCAQALKFYSRALKLGRGDENLYYNMARAMFEKGSPAQALSLLHKALHINPAFEEGRQFFLFLDNFVKQKPSPDSL